MNVEDIIADAVRKAVSKELTAIYKHLQGIDQKVQSIIDDAGAARAMDIDELSIRVEKLTATLEDQERRRDLAELRARV